MRFSFIYLNNFRLLCTLILTSYLFSCASPQAPKKKLTKPTVNIDQEAKVTVQVSAQQLVNQAKLANPVAANQLFIEASKHYLQEQNFTKSLWLSNQLLTLEQTPQQQYQLLLVLAASYQQLDSLQEAEQQIEKLNLLANQHALKHSLPYFQLIHQIANQQNKSIMALNANLHAFAINPNATNEDINAIWQQLSLLATWQQQQLKSLTPPHIEGWLNLLKITNQYGTATNFQQKLRIWQLTFSSHPAQALLAQLITEHDANQYETYKHVAVILPLTGQQAEAGYAAQQGILASYGNDEKVTLHFVDSNAPSFDTLEQTLTTNNIDFVIGPLLKEKVDWYLSQVNLTLPTLLLNLPTQADLKPNQFAISMRPEDEAIQAATILSQKGYKKPVVINNRDSISQRIASAFVQQWQQQTNNKPETITFEQNSQMQEMLKEALAVDSSQARIKALRYQVRETLKSEPRNRRDIDMIYIVGNLQQTRLLKPYIDVNTSPFSELIPIFASSRSHSMNLDESTRHDLIGLTFTQMPWLLSSKQQDKSLASISNTLWPKRSDSLHRIFAMGVDSFALMNKLTQMKQTPYLRYYGQTGIIQLHKNNILTRSLIWGIYRRDKASEIVME